MNRASAGLFGLLFIVGACGSEPKVPGDPPNAAPALAVTADGPASSEVAPRASGKTIGIGFAANMVGEIEPCGCKANPTGGLARRMTILDRWRAGNPEAAPGAEAAVDPRVAQIEAEQDPATKLKLAQIPIEPRLGPVRFDGFLIVDGGDAFSDSPMLDGERRARAIATARLIVERFSEEGMSAQLIGDKDLGLGREALAELQRAAKYPFIATNLVDAKTQAPVFATHTRVEVAGVRVGLIGLLATRAPRAPTLAQEGLALLPPAEAAKAAIAALEKDGVDLVIALSQLSPVEEEELARELPRIQLFLGGDQLAHSQGPQPVASAFSLSGGHKGRQVAIAALSLHDPRGAAAPFFDPHQRRVLEQKRREAEQRVATFERLLAEAERRDAEAQQSPEAQPDGLRRRSPLSAYQNQLAAARADLQLAQAQLEELAGLDAAQREGGAPSPRNTVGLQLVNLGREVPDHEAVKARVDAFRRDVPATHTH